MSADRMSIHVVKQEVCALPPGPRTTYEFSIRGFEYKLVSSREDITRAEVIAYSVLEQFLNGAEWGLIYTDGTENLRAETKLELAFDSVLHLLAFCELARIERECALRMASIA